MCTYIYKYIYGLRVWAFGSSTWGLGFGVHGLGFRALGFEFRAVNEGFIGFWVYRVWGLGPTV